MATFIWPTDTKRITSKFRTKERPDHHGVDIADPGYHPIYAVADGEVSKSYFSTSYGHVIFIVHKIAGQVYESVYAHLKSRAVSVGEKVKQGQVIGVMGNTGRSYGQHLHFEWHEGRWNMGKTNAIDPLKVIGVEDKKEANVLRHGDKGKEVKSLQEKLVALGYKLPKYGTDGHFGDETEAAVKAFQKDQSIKVDGIVGPVTQSKLDNAKKKKTLYLPKTAQTWRVYALNVAPVKGNEKAFLKPAKFGGLQYEVLDIPQKDVVTIQTRDFGKVNIYVAASTGAVIK
ncbi:hypothetical protein HNQ94_000388 [Salirhabdus euzebyi]|uniref:Peptidoglycan binding domain-containing protein n=1 Tax=Salirhabdus euzebyi TaxID=394506 RepID=A0A841PSN2_9BACI|nr:peptidoglycan DD-metalloendopeptidase family protein [Salirhabdus euzebyi]MBB6451967.1 hypothetical protein [Salirhabdus euzebyi]